MGCHSLVINDDDSCGLFEKIDISMWKIEIHDKINEGILGGRFYGKSKSRKSDISRASESN